MDFGSGAAVKPAPRSPQVTPAKKINTSSFTLRFFGVDGGGDGGDGGGDGCGRDTCARVCGAGRGLLARQSKMVKIII